MAITPNFELYSDVVISEQDDINLFEEKIKQGDYKSATTVIEKNNSLSKKGFRASFFNLMEEKIKELQIYLLNKTAEPDEYYSISKPDENFMKENGYIFWIKPVE